MQVLIQRSLKGVTNLNQVQKNLLYVLSLFKNGQPRTHIGYISGIINSDGPDNIRTNLKILRKHTLKIRTFSQFPVFSPTDVFPPHIYLKLDEVKNLDVSRREQKFNFFWERVLESELITHIFMTPRWELSKGARNEHQVASKLGLEIQYTEQFIR